MIRSSCSLFQKSKYIRVVILVRMGMPVVISIKSLWLVFWARSSQNVLELTQINSVFRHLSLVG